MPRAAPEMDFPAQLRLLVNILVCLTAWVCGFPSLFLPELAALMLLPYKYILRNSYTQEKTSGQQRGSGRDICLYSSDASPEPFPPAADSGAQRSSGWLSPLLCVEILRSGSCWVPRSELLSWWSVWPWLVGPPSCIPFCLTQNFLWYFP